MNHYYHPIVFLFSFLIIVSSFAETVGNRYSLNGGMFYHLGVARAVFGETEISGITRGLGGRMAFHISPSFRVGGMGFSTGFTYNARSGVKGSFVNMKAGGFTAEYVHAFNPNLRVSLGVLAGGAGLRHLEIISVEGDKKLVTYETYGTFIGSPLILFEYLIGKRYSLTLMHNWVIGNNVISGYSYGHCFNAGVLFNR